MKFSKSSRMSLVLGVVVMGAIMVYIICSQQVQQRQDLETQLTAAQKKLAQLKIDDLVAQKDQLIQNKESYSAQIAAAKTTLAAPVDSISATDMILESAHSFNLKIANINSGGKSNRTFVSNKFMILPLTVQVEGATNDIAAFVSNIKTLFPTALVETYQFSIGSQAPAPSTAPVPGADGTETAPTVTLVPGADPGGEATPAVTVVLPNSTISTINISIYDYKGDSNVD